MYFYIKIEIGEKIRITYKIIIWIKIYISNLLKTYVNN